MTELQRFLAATEEEEEEEARRRRRCSSIVKVGMRSGCVFCYARKRIGALAASLPYSRRSSGFLRATV
jgi:hypothetical protein